MLTVITNRELIRLLYNARGTGLLAGLSHTPPEKNIGDVTFEGIAVVGVRENDKVCERHRHVRCGPKSFNVSHG